MIKVREKKSKYGFMIRTRDRIDITKQTLPALANEKDIDVYWIDGSVTAEGQELANHHYQDLPGLCEIHTGLNRGQVPAFIHGVKCLIGQNYDYVGFIDGDVLVTGNWFEQMLALYEQGKNDGLNVGAVSARAIVDRVLIPRNGYAVMSNIGGGMVMMKREIFLGLMRNPSNCVLNNPQFKFSALIKQMKELTGLDYPFMRQVREELANIESYEVGVTHDWLVSNDWWWETILLRQGLVSLSTTPCLAYNIDEDGMKDPIVETATIVDPTFDWQQFLDLLNRRYNSL